MGFTIDLLPALADNYIYLVSDADLGLAMAVDPGDPEVVFKELRKRDLHLALILNTHHHPDHTGGNGKLQAAYGAPIIGPAKERHKIEALSRGVEEGALVTFSDLRGQVLDTPGHTSGGISFYFPALKALFCGDTLFSLGCGRLFEGTAAQMWGSFQKIKALPDDTKLYPGHEYTEKNATFALAVDKDNQDLKARIEDIAKCKKKGLPTVPVTLEIEKKTNPFLRVDDPAFKKRLEKAGLSQDADPAALFGALRAAKDRHTMP